MSRNILVVDDSEINCKFLKRSLEALNCSVFTENNGENALSYIYRNTDSLDLIILDVVMPTIDGYQVLDRIRSNEKSCNIPVIMLTVKKEEHDFIEGYQNGADYYISKPTNKKQLAYAMKVLNIK